MVYFANFYAQTVAPSQSAKLETQGTTSTASAILRTTHAETDNTFQLLTIFKSEIFQLLSVVHSKIFWLEGQETTPEIQAKLIELGATIAKIQDSLGLICTLHSLLKGNKNTTPYDLLPLLPPCFGDRVAEINPAREDMETKIIADYQALQKLIGLLIRGIIGDSTTEEINLYLDVSKDDQYLLLKLSFIPNEHTSRFIASLKEPSNNFISLVINALARLNEITVEFMEEEITMVIPKANSTTET